MAVSTSAISDAKAAITGAVHVAPIGTTLPTDASTALPSTYKTFYSKSDGCTLKVEHNTLELDAWEADNVLVLNDSNNVELIINPMEVMGLNETIAGLMFGSDNVTATSGVVSAISITDDLPEEVVIVVETVLRDGSKQRVIIPRWQCTTMGDIVFKRGEVNVPQLTGKCLPDSNGKKVDIKLAAPASDDE